MKITKPFCFDDEKDSELLLWLERKNNRSAFVRNLLYDKMHEEKYGLIKTVAVQPDKQEIKEKSKKRKEFIRDLIKMGDE